jgi:hypothetical protein
MAGQSAESIAVTRIIVQLKDAISKNKTVFNNNVGFSAGRLDTP